MDWGMRNRLSRIIKPDDSRCLMLAVDHGYFLGPTDKLEVPSTTIGPLAQFVDSIMLTRGILRTSVNPALDVPTALRVSGRSNIIGEDLSKDEITTSIAQAIPVTASCLALSTFARSKYE